MTRYTNPFEELDRMLERMSSQFERMDARSFDPGVSMYGINVDVRVAGDEIVVAADLPGFEKDDIDLSVSERTLTISAEREMDESDESGEYLRRERRSASLRRSVTLPEDVDEEHCSATYTNGVLTVTLPLLHVEEADDSHHIDVN